MKQTKLFVKKAIAAVMLLQAFQFVGRSEDMSLLMQTYSVFINADNISVSNVSMELTKQTAVAFSYSDETGSMVLDAVRVSMKDASLESILESVFSGTNIAWMVKDGMIGLYQSEPSSPISEPEVKSRPISLQQNEDVRLSGKITDGNGNPLAAASIYVPGVSGYYAVSDLDGNFSINVPKGSKVAFALLGYKDAVVDAIENRSGLNISLEEEVNLLDDVVVVGFGSQKKVNLTGAVTSVAGDEMNKRPVLDASSMLQGMVPGLRVVQNSGQPGSEGISFRVRGQGTYSSAGSNPLVLINGVPGSLTNMDPSVIESVSVLKDAASASIYGARAANGVILVTTKKGSLSTTGKQFSARYSGTFAIHTPTRMLDVVSNSAEYMELFNLAKENSGKPGRYSDEEIKLYKEKGGSEMYPDFDWVDYMFHPAFVQNHNLALSGSSDKTTYNVTLNIADQPGTLRGYKYKKYTATTDLTSQLTDWLKIGTYISANYGDKIEPRNGSTDAFLATMSQAPTYMPWLPDDGSGKKKYTYTAFSVEENNKNMPAMIANGINATGRTTDINGQFFVEISPVKGLIWHTKLAGSLVNSISKDWSGVTVPLYNYHSGEFARNMDLGGGQIPGYSQSQTNDIYTNLYSYLEYTVPFTNDDHSLKMMVGYNQEKEVTEYMYAKRRNYQFNLTELDAGSETDMENSGSSQAWSLMSGYFRVNYNYKGKYLAEVNGRYDGTSRISPARRWGFFPSFSLGYRISEEKFMRNLDWLSNLKIRGSWGQLGNQNIGLYPYQALVSLTDSYSFDNVNLTQGVAQTAYVNSDLMWETTTILDAGLDATLFDRLGLTFDWYKKNTTDILRGAQVSSFIGLSAPTINDGEMQNTGIELALTWDDIVKDGTFRGLRYNAGINFDRSRNKLVKFGADEKSGTTILSEGLPYGSFYMLECLGVFKDQNEIDNSPKQFSDRTQPGDLKYMDWDNDGDVDDDDRHVVPGKFPDFEYSFNLGASWKGIDFYMMFQGVQGISIYNGSGWGITPFYQGSAPTKDYIAGMWTEANPDNAVNPRLYYGDMGGGRNTRASTYFLRDGSYLRLKNLTLGYTFPGELTRKAAIQSLRIFFSGDNLLTFTNYGGLDPERSGSGTYVAYPQNKVYSFGINVEF